MAAIFSAVTRAASESLLFFLNFRFSRIASDGMMLKIILYNRKIQALIFLVFL